MSSMYTIDPTTGDVYITLSLAQTSAFQQVHVRLDAKATIAEANNFLENVSLRPLLAVPALEVNDDEEEQEWDALFALPHVQAGLSRLADAAQRQFATGETEEGGFAVE